VDFETHNFYRFNRTRHASGLMVLGAMLALLACCPWRYITAQVLASSARRVDRTRGERSSRTEVRDPVGERDSALRHNLYQNKLISEAADSGGLHGFER